ncbi:MAG: peptidoglycan editing factor PgeF [Alphaproteobacteria bacterium]|nr:peptidoglycan editing factor PgeF [Alphaproteobacteria bacterium]
MEPTPVPNAGRSAESVELLEPPALVGGSVRAAFFTRRGGVSRGIHAGLNVGFGSDDAADAVAENRRRAMAALAEAPPPLVTVHQVHGRAVAAVDAPWPRADNPKADALVTDRPGIALGILTADCAPILFADAAAGVIGAAHSGWKGACLGVGAATVEAMERLGARRSRIRAALGPTIHQPSYEVGPEFHARFAEEHPESLRFFAPAPAAQKHLFDLPGFVAAHLEGLGLAVVDRTCAHDTLPDAARFYSYRRATQRGEPDYGRQLSAILLAE